MFRSTRLPRSFAHLAVVAALATAAGCSAAELSASSSTTAEADDSTDAIDTTDDTDSTADAASTSGSASSESSASTASSSSSSSSSSPSNGNSLPAAAGFGAVGELDSAAVHDVEVTFDDEAFATLLATYSSTGDKEWIEATVTIDGATFERVGLRLKGNSSLRGLTREADAADPSELPWLIRLDKYVDGQDLDGLTDLVVRSNNTETALNEAVALELLEIAGLASQDAIAASFSVNGSDPTLRLMIEHPDDEWMTEWFDDDGALYKAESTGDYSYRGDDPDAYDEVFDQEAGKENTDLEPLIEFLSFISDSDDATFAAELDEYLDVESFATYLAMQELIDNFDDIDGPGNNSYLHWDADSGRFTVVPWDHNLAFGARNGLGGGEVVGGGLGGERPEGAPDLPRDIAGAPPIGEDGDFTDRGPGGAMGRSNVLVERFLAMDEYDALYEQQLESLRVALFDSGVADEVLAAWAAVVELSGLVDSTVVAEESATIAASFG